MTEFERLFAESETYIRSALWHKAPLELRNDSDIEDLVQMARIRAWRGFHTWTRDANFRTWLFRVALNSAYDESRKRRRHLKRLVEIDAPVLDDLTVSDILASPVDLQAELEAGETMRAISLAMKQLPEVIADVAKLFFFDQLSYEDIATELDVPIGTVKSRISRARDKLTELIPQIMESDQLHGAEGKITTMSSIDLTREALEAFPDKVQKAREAVIREALANTTCTVTLEQLTQIVDGAGASKRSPRSRAPKGSKALSDADRQTVYALADHGKSAAEIVSETGFFAPAVSALLRGRKTPQ